GTVEAVQWGGEKQTVVGAEGDEDALGLHRAGDEVTAAHLTFRDGALENCRRFSFRSALPAEVLLGDLLPRLYEGDVYVPRRVLVPAAPAEHALIAAWLAHKRRRAGEPPLPQRRRNDRPLQLPEHKAALTDAAPGEIHTGRAL